jgi:hypothetical protein
MSRVLLTGWKAGLNKVELTTVLRRHAAVGLAQAKQWVDQLLDGQAVAIACRDDEAALQLLESARSLGALGTVETGITTGESTAS